MIQERHRHRYEVNNVLRYKLLEQGMRFAGMNTATDLVEIVELPDKRWFVGVQFHPEYKSSCWETASAVPFFCGRGSCTTQRAKPEARWKTCISWQLGIRPIVECRFSNAEWHCPYDPCHPERSRGISSGLAARLFMSSS